jgi:hypothetical protein
LTVRRADEAEIVTYRKAAMQAQTKTWSWHIWSI